MSMPHTGAVLDVSEAAERNAWLLPLLHDLDWLLKQAVETFQAEAGASTGSDRFRGLYVTRMDAASALQRAPATPAFSPSASVPQSFAPGSPLEELGRAFALSSFDLMVVLLALAPEADLRYERVYAFLQDDVTRKLPTVDLALNLLCASTGERLGRYERFLPEAPLLRHRLIRLLPNPGCASASLLAHFMKLDEQILHILLGSRRLDKRLLDFCTLMTANDLPEEMPPALSGLPELASMENRQEEGPLIFLLRSESSWQRHRAALAACGGKPLLVADLSCCGENAAALQEKILLLLRDARLHGAIACLEKFENLNPSVLTRALAEAQDPVILGSMNSEAFRRLQRARPSRSLCLPSPALSARNTGSMYSISLAFLSKMMRWTVSAATGSRRSRSSSVAPVPPEWPGRKADLPLPPALPGDLQ
jgi:hypothetical protein